MGIYDREYYREERSRTPSFLPQTVVGAIIAVNVLIWLADFFLCLKSENAPPNHLAERFDGRPC